MPSLRPPGAAPVGRRIRLRSRIRLPPRPRPERAKPVQHAAATVGAAFGLGAGYLLIAIVGLTAAADVIPVNTPDNWLHSIVGTAMLGLALLPGRRRL